MSQTPKRIVSKGQYAKAQAKRVGWDCLIIVLGFMIVEFGGASVISIADFLCGCRYQPNFSKALDAVICIPITFCFWKSCRVSYRQLQKVDKVVFLTRTNTAALRADETLVRASEQPVTPQGDILLRPVDETQDSHEEQLLRPS